MSTVHVEGTWPIELDLGPARRRMSSREFLEFCSRNGDVRMEMTSEGNVIVMVPSGFESSCTETELVRQLANWAAIEGRGQAAGPQAGFELPNRAIRSPDASWTRLDRISCLTLEQRRGFLPLAPDFVVEVPSPSDRLKNFHAKLVEYIDNGVRLGWLIDPDTKTIWVYQPGVEPKQLDNPAEVAGDPVLPGFALNVTKLWL
jgi:Uma2 family endonuclease